MGLDLSNANEIGGNDPEFLKELLGVYIKRFPEYHQGLEEAISSGDLKEMGFKIHRVKSATSVIGHKTFCDELRDTENYCLSPEANPTKAVELCNSMMQKFEQSLNEVRTYLSKME